MIRNLDAYSGFYNKYISGSYDEMSRLSDIDNYMDVELRKNFRWGKGYETLQGIASAVKCTPSAIVLVPSTAYIKATNPSFEIPEPTVCYYYSGLKIAWPSSKYVVDATHVFLVTDKGAGVMKIDTKAQLDSFIKVYNKYKY